MSKNETAEQSIDDSAAVESTAHGNEQANAVVRLDKNDDLLCSLNEMTTSLCSTCCRIFYRGPIEVPSEDAGNRNYLVFHPSLASLRDSVDAGCRICKHISQSLDRFCDRYETPSTPTELLSIRYRLNTHHLWRKDVGSSKDPFMMSYYLWESDCYDPPGRYYGPHPFVTTDFFPADCLGLGPDFLDPSIETSTAKSTASMNVARHWYQQCLSHSTCRNWRQDSRCLPTRLVRIWRPDDDFPDIIFAMLCETSHLPLSTAYVTLSHRWGDNQIFQLRQNNIEELRQCVPFNQLPQLFRDAMYVSLELGINYIWIDSLCIIQDLKEDWTHEAKRMGDVYQYAACNIAATGYRDSSLGLFSERKALPQVYPPLISDRVMTSSYRGHTTTASLQGLYVRGQRGEFYWRIGLSILNSRAWVAQERALSPGIIHFTPEMMWWECNHLVANEAFPTGSIYEQDDEQFKTCTIRNLTIESKPEDIYAFWRKFISLYASYKLTYEQDRFPAAIGIARTLAELIDDNFVAGFWEGDLIRSLLMRHPGRIEDVSTIQRAPSWSWASLRAGCLTTHMASRTQTLTGVSISVLSDVPGFKSDLDSTSLETSDVRGLKITAPLRRLPGDIKDSFGSKLSDGKVFGWYLSVSINDAASETSDSSDDDTPEHETWRLREPTHVLVLAQEYGYSYANDESEAVRETCPVAWALLLQQVPEAESRNTFRKQGVAAFQFRGEDILKECFGLQKDDEEYVPGPIFEEMGFQEIILI